jgi:ubiquitin carboxyl-terminal hydrolase 7
MGSSTLKMNKTRSNSPSKLNSSSYNRIKSGSNSRDRSNTSSRYLRRKFRDSPEYEMEGENPNLSISGEEFRSDQNVNEHEIDSIFGEFVETSDILSRLDYEIVDERAFEFNVNDFESLVNFERILSPLFVVGGTRWRIIIDRKDISNLKRVLELSLNSHDSSFGRDSICTQFVVNVNDQSLKEQCYRFNRNRQCFIGDIEEPERLKVRIQLKIVKDPSSTLWQTIDFRYNSKDETGYIGLKNQGATCYMNSLLQCLFFINEFKRLVFSIPAKIQESSVVLALQKLFYSLQISKEPVSTKELTKSFGWDSYESLLQRDIQEFSRILQDTLESKMKGTDVEGKLDKLFMGQTKRYTRCLDVEYESSVIESYYDISLPVNNMSGILESFRKFIEPELLVDDNKYKADGYGYQNAKTGTIFKSFPPILFLHLRRFEYDMMSDQTLKVNDRYEFPLSIDLGEFLENGGGKEEYDLFGILVHSGDVGGGHYYTYLRDFSQGRYLKFDDDLVTFATEKEAVQDNFGGEVGDRSRSSRGGRHSVKNNFTNAYMLIYISERDRDRILSPMELSFIRQELIDCVKEDNKLVETRLFQQNQAHLFMYIRVFSLKHLREWSGEGRYGILGDGRMGEDGQYESPINCMNLIKVNKDGFLESMKEQIEKLDGIPRHRQQLWRYSMVDKRIIESIEPYMNYKLEDLEMNPIIYAREEDSQVESSILLFVKEFRDESVRIIWDLSVNPLTKFWSQVIPRIIRMLGHSRAFVLYLERENELISLQLGEIDKSVEDLGLLMGDVIIIDPKGVENRKFISVSDYYKFLENHVKVILRPLPCSSFDILRDDEKSIVVIEVSKHESLAKISQRLIDSIEHKGISNRYLMAENVRFFGFDSIMDGPKSFPFENPYSGLNLKDVLELSTDTTINSIYYQNILYYEILDRSLEIFENLQPIQVYCVNPINKRIICEWILQDYVKGDSDQTRFKGFNVQTVIRSLEQKQHSPILECFKNLDETVYSNLFRLILVNTKTHMIDGEYYDNFIDTMTSLQQLYLERVLVEELELRENRNNKVITVFSFHRNLERTHGSPFRFVLIENEKFKTTRKRIISRLGLNEIQASRCKFVIVNDAEVIYHADYSDNCNDLNDPQFDDESVLADYSWTNDRILGIDCIDKHAPRPSFEQTFRIHG